MFKNRKIKLIGKEIPRFKTKKAKISLRLLKMDEND